MAKRRLDPSCRARGPPVTPALDCGTLWLPLDMGYQSLEGAMGSSPRANRLASD